MRERFEVGGVRLVIEGEGMGGKVVIKMGWEGVGKRWDEGGV